MALELTVARVEALAPDASAVAGAKRLGRPGPWKNLGQSGAALWGECQGSALYQTSVALAELAARCTCPSRRSPCKHALGLLFLAARAPQSFSVSAEPEWVTSWLRRRGAAQERRAARASAGGKPLDVAARARRAEKRHDNILAGIEQLDAWMNDLVRQGLARVQGESAGFWDARARRLVDAQAPGLASRVRRLGSRVGSDERWAARVLDALGQLALLTHAWRRLDQLEPNVAADVRRLVGLTLTQADVIAHGDLVDDEWRVLADRVFDDDEDRVSMQRAWLRGERSGRTALILQFAAAGGRFDQALATGMQLDARLAFWPSAAPQRALIVERRSGEALFPAAPSAEGVEAALARFAAMLAGCPWIESTLLVLGDVRPIAGEPVLLADAAGRALPLAAGDHDVLFALSGGQGLTLTGEWDGYALSPRCAWAEGRMVVLGRSA